MMRSLRGPRRVFMGLTGILAAALALVMADSARAQERPLQFIVGYPAGGGTDTLARVLADAIKRTTGRAAIVRNIPGAGGQIAAVTLLREGGDGSVILAINQPDLQLAVMRDTAALKASDFQTIMVDVRDPRVILVKRGSEISSFAALVERARARPGTVSVSVTAGSGQELFAKWLFGRLGLDVTVAGYRGGAEASNALLTGDVQATIGDDFARLNMRDTTQALVVGAKVASPRWPEAPTLSEALAPLGVVPPSPDFLSRYGVYVVPASFKASQPPAYVELQAMLLKARGAPEVLDYITRNKFEDLSIARPVEAMGPAIDADLAEIARIR